MYYKIASIVLNSEQQKSSTSDIFIAQPDSQKEELAGKLFILAEIESAEAEAAKILAFLITNLNFNYYQSEKIILKERIETISIENIFESALAKTNKDLAEFLDREKIRISPHAFNITAAILYKNDLFFTTIGKNKNLLVYKEKPAAKPLRKKTEPEAEKIEYRLSDIGQNQENGNEAININRLFSEVSVGKIPVGGYFIIINEALSEYLSHKQLLKIVTKLSPASAAEQIRNMLEQVNSVVSFLGVIIKNTVSANLSDEELRKKIEEETKSFDYTPQITATEEQTEKIMTPAGIINLKKAFNFSKNIPAPLAANFASSAKESLKKMFLSRSNVSFKKRISFFSLEKIILSLKKIGAFGKALFGAFGKEKNSFEQEEAETSLEKQKAPPARRRAKYLLIAAALLIAILAVNIYLTGQKNKRAEKLRAFNSLLAQIDKNQNKIESLLLYGNESEAWNILSEDGKLLAQIAPEEAEKQEMIRGLIAKQKIQTEKLQHINRIASAVKIADFSNLNQAASAQNLFLSENFLYAGDYANKAAYKIDLKENVITAVYNLPDAGEMKFPAAGENGSLYYFGTNGLIALNKDGTSKKLALELPSKPENITGAKLYNDKLYLLDKEAGQIFRYTHNGESFNEKTEWLENKIDLSSSANIFIDGNVYILYQNGQIDKYLKGKKEVFSLPAITEAITGASRLIATEKYFYIFEMSKKRLAIFNAKGEFQKQYIFDALAAPRDLAINETLKKIYLLDGNSVYETELSGI